MFAPIDPPNVGYPQMTAYNDGPQGPSSFLYPGVGQIARGMGQLQPAQPDPRAQLLQMLTQMGHAHAMPMPLHPQYPGSDIFVGPGGYHGQPQNTHFSQVAAAHSLAQFLAQQHQAGLRRYNGPH